MGLKKKKPSDIQVLQSRPFENIVAVSNSTEVKEEGV